MKEFSVDDAGVKKYRRKSLAAFVIFFVLLGLALTGFAVSQGAPFWFDLLNKIIVIRSTVKPAEKSRTQPSKDRPAPATEIEKDADSDDEPSKG